MSWSRTDFITEEDFREFVFTNPLRFWGEGRPDFFKGTVLESAGGRGAS